MIEALRIALRPALGLVALGLFWGVFVAWLPEVKAAAGVDDGALGLTLLGAAFGNMVAMAAHPRLHRRFGAALLPGTGLVLAAVVAAQAAGQDGAVALFAGMFVMGLGMSSLDIAAHVRLSVLEGSRGVPLMNLAHGMFSLAVAVAALLAGLGRGAGLGQGPVLAILAAVLAALALAMREPGEAAPDPDEEGPGARLTPWAVVLPAGLILFASFIAENATETWSALHLERTLGGAPGEGAFGPAMMGLTMAAGRFAGQAMAARWGEARLVSVSTVIAMAGALVIAAAPSRGVAIAGIALVGIGVSVVVPSANALLGRRVGDATRPLALSRAWLFGFTGFFVGPVAIGWVADTAGLRAGFVVVAGVMGLILAGLWRLLRQPPVPRGGQT